MANSDLTGKQLGEFKLLRPLGSGGMADVYLAEQTTLQRYVAVKVMKPSLMAHSGLDMVARFKQEAMMAAGLNHPNIVQVYTIGEDQGLHYIAQEFVEGKNLATLLKGRGKPDVGSALHVIRQVAMALKASGQAGIVHRDIKPENIMVTKKGEVKVADFGLAQLGQSGTERKGVTMGTPLYMSPEQISGRELDPRSDVYSFGITAYQLLCGETAFKGNTAVDIVMQHLKNPPPPLKTKNPDLPDVLCRLVHRMMAKRRTLRYQSAGEVLEDVKLLITAFKQGRSLDLVRLPRLEQLDRLARLAQSSPGQGADAAVDKAEMLLGPDVVLETVESAPEIAIDQEESEELPGAKPQVLHASRMRAWDLLDSLPPVPKKKRASQGADIDLTPAVDVTFQLLIFFMITASFSLQKAFDVPPAKTAEGISMNVQVEMPDAGVRVEVDRDNVVYVGDRKAQTFKEILDLLTAEKSANSSVNDLDLILDPDSTHEMRVTVIDAATQAGFLRVKNKIQEL
ncbi:MAG: protein kinase [Planctomycetaceae bacterium]|nr:protein kinase [Planctomycetaceae bacterium]